MVHVRPTPPLEESTVYTHNIRHIRPEFTPPEYIVVSSSDDDDVSEIDGVAGPDRVLYRYPGGINTSESRQNATQAEASQATRTPADTDNVGSTQSNKPKVSSDAELYKKLNTERFNTLWNHFASQTVSVKYKTCVFIHKDYFHFRPGKPIDIYFPKTLKEMATNIRIYENAISVEGAKLNIEKKTDTITLSDCASYTAKIEQISSYADQILNKRKEIMNTTYNNMRDKYVDIFPDDPEYKAYRLDEIPIASADFVRNLNYIDSKLDALEQKYAIPSQKSHISFTQDRTFDVFMASINSFKGRLDNIEKNIVKPFTCEIGNGRRSDQIFTVVTEAMEYLDENKELIALNEGTYLSLWRELSEQRNTSGFRKHGDNRVASEIIASFLGLIVKDGDVTFNPGGLRVKDETSDERLENGIETISRIEFSNRAIVYTNINDVFEKI